MRARRLPGLFAAMVAFAACSQAPYTASDGRADLVAAGYSDAEANCVIDGLDAYFRDEFVALQESEGIEPGLIPKLQADLFVKNKFAGVGDIPADLDDEAARLVDDCRS